MDADYAADDDAAVPCYMESAVTMLGLGKKAVMRW